jgi:hypothetical protein
VGEGRQGRSPDEADTRCVGYLECWANEPFLMGTTMRWRSKKKKPLLKLTRQCRKGVSYFSLFLSIIDMGLGGGHKNSVVFRGAVGEVFF